MSYVLWKAVGHLLLRIAITMARLPGKSGRFSPEETDVLMCESERCEPII